jgi:hypothetical protein
LYDPIHCIAGDVSPEEIDNAGIADNSGKKGVAKTFQNERV